MGVDLHCDSRIYHGIRAIALDKDGTLANTQQFLLDLARRRAGAIESEVAGVGRCLLAAWGLAGDHLSPGGLMAVGSRLENEIVSAGYVAARGWAWGEARALVQKSFEWADRAGPPKASQTPPYPEVAETLHAWYNAGLKLAIVSADAGRHVRQFLATYGLQDYIGAIATADDGWQKPDPAGFLAVCHQLEVSPAQTLMIGDASVDAALAIAGGAAGAIGVQRQAGPPARGFDVLLSSLAEVRPLAAALSP